MKAKRYFGRTVFTMIISIGLCVQAQAQQQLGTYLQYSQHPEQINAAYTLASDKAKIYSVGRKQWAGVDGAPTTMLAGGHFKTKNGRSAIGANMLYDKIGPERYTEVNGFYGHAIRLSENDYISGAISLGVRFYNFRESLLEHDDMSIHSDINDKVGSFNLSFMYYRPESFYIGISLPRLGTGEFKEVEVFRENYSAVGAYLFEVDNGFHVKANTWVSWMKNRDVLANIAATAYFNRTFGIGINYGTAKDFGCFASFALQERLKLGYGYQFGVAGNSMTGMRNGSHEISISYHFSTPSLL